MPTFYLPPPRPLRPKNPADTELAGADVEFRGGMRVSSGDWALVSGDAAAEQSVRREAVANPGSLVRRPSWGAGGSDVVFRSLTPQTIGQMISRQRAQLQKNPRVASVIDVTAKRLPSNQGTSLVLEYVPVGAQRPTNTVLKPRR